MRGNPSPTGRLEPILALRDSGLFAEALQTFDKIPHDSTLRTPAQILRAELLERVGRRREADTIIRRALYAKNLSPTDRSLCEFVLARIQIENGDLESAVAHLNKAISLAHRAGDFEQVGFAQLKLLT